MAFILYISPYSELDLQHQLNLSIILTTFHGTLDRRHHVSGRLEGNVFNVIFNQCDEICHVI
jgi:hypothetical protein